MAWYYVVDLAAGRVVQSGNCAPDDVAAMADVFPGCVVRQSGDDIGDPEDWTVDPQGRLERRPEPAAVTRARLREDRRLATEHRAEAAKIRRAAAIERVTDPATRAALREIFGI